MSEAALAGKTAVVTGSTGGGLGAEIARMLCSRGARVVVTGRNADAGSRLVRELTGGGGSALFVRADLTSDEDCAALIGSAAAWGDGVDVLVNNAYRGEPADDGTAWDVGLDTWEATFRVNVRAPLLLIRQAAPLMRAAGGGAIVNVSSRVARRASRRMAAYAASKGALEALTRSVAVDGAVHSIRCNAVSPGYLLGKERDPELSSRHRELLEAMHLGPIPTVTEVAEVVAFLACDASRSITGATIAVDAGGTIARAASFR
jgi:NAD(P)-dependent dehydrogenase (short-subunit alcohol dehydrogenase family)